MPTKTPFTDVLEAADHLSLAEQENLVEVLHHRIVERRREELAKDIDEAQTEFARGESEPRSARELMKEILG